MQLYDLIKSNTFYCSDMNICEDWKRENSLQALVSVFEKRETSTDLCLLYVSFSCVFRSGLPPSGRGGGDRLLAQYGPDLP